MMRKTILFHTYPHKKRIHIVPDKVAQIKCVEQDVSSILTIGTQEWTKVYGDVEVVEAKLRGHTMDLKETCD